MRGPGWFVRARGDKELLRGRSSTPVFRFCGELLGTPGLNAIRRGHAQTSAISRSTKLGPYKEPNQIADDGTDRRI